MDLTKYVEHHDFAFDDVLDEGVSNDAVYRSTVQPLVATIFRAGKARPHLVCSHAPEHSLFLPSMPSQGPPVAGFPNASGVAGALSDTR